jgi:predicted Kef-type K+ transport protein
VRLGSALTGISVILGAFLSGLAFVATETAWRSGRCLPAMREGVAAPLLVSVGAMFDPFSLGGQCFAITSAAVVVICARSAMAWLSARAVGTSTPEPAVGIDAAAIGNGVLAVTNIAGTNTVNVLLTLGLSTFIHPLAPRSQTIRMTSR